MKPLPPKPSNPILKPIDVNALIERVRKEKMMGDAA